MKNFFFLFTFVLFTFGLNAQEVSKDTTYLVWYEGNFHEARDIRYTPIGQNLDINPVPIGDTLQTMEVLKTQYINLTQEVGGTAISYILGSRILRAKTRDLKKLYTSIGKASIEDIVTDHFYPEFTGSSRVLATYRFVVGGNNLGNYELFQRNNKSLRFRQASDTNVFYAAERRSENTIVLSINSVPVPVFKLGQNDKGKTIWEDITGKYRLIEQ